MTTPSTEQITAALATVNDPEIRRPITDLGMVDEIRVDDDGDVEVRILLTVSGCPMRDPLTNDVTAAVRAVAGVSRVRGRLRRDERRAALRACRPRCAAARPPRRSPSPSPAR